MPASSYFAGRRDERVAALGVGSIGLSLLGTILAPLWMLALGPIVLGVPHLLADLRYCVVRPGWHRQPALWVGLGLPLAAVALGASTAAGFAAVAGVCAGVASQPGRPIPTWRRALGIGLAGLAALICAATGPRATLLLLHLHNFVAVLLWWRWRARRGVASTLPLALFLAGTGLICAGAFDHAWLHFAPAQLELELGAHLAALAPGLDGVLGLRLLLLFVFAQSVHYVIWLRLIPEDDRERATPRSFGASWRTLLDELGPLVWIAVALSVVVVVWALLDLAAARSGYLRLASFHAFLELAVLASLWVRNHPHVIPSASN